MRNYLQSKNAILNFFFSLLCTINNFFKRFTKFPFSKNYFYQLILLFNLFLLLFMSLITLFNIIYGFHYIILANFYLYLPYFQQKNFSFNKISRSQMDTKKVMDWEYLFFSQTKLKWWKVHFSLLKNFDMVLRSFVY